MTDEPYQIALGAAKRPFEGKSNVRGGDIDKLLLGREPHAGCRPTCGILLADRRSGPSCLRLLKV